MAKARKKANGAAKRSTVRRLLIANLLVALGLLTLTVTVLFALGLLESVFAFIF